MSQQPGDAVVDDAVNDVDPYGEATAEFYDLLATGMWEPFGKQLLDLLADVDPSSGPIIDIGSGSGIGLRYLHAAVPDARVHAIEPSKAMRTALHTRLADDEALRETTTVVPFSFADAPLPELACAVIVSAAYGHLSGAERSRLWQYLAKCMPAGAPVVIGVLPPDRPTTVPLVRYRALAVGDYTYEGWQSGKPVDDRTMSWTLVYRVLDGDRMIAEHTASSQWRCDGVDDIRTEIAPYGLELTEHEDCVLIHRSVCL